VYAGLSSQPLGGQVQTNNLQNSAASGASSNAAAADQSGVVSGKAYQSASATSPLTPYNTAMENSIGNVVQQVTSSFGKQPGSNLQQQSGAAATSDIAAANQFTEVGMGKNFSHYCQSQGINKKSLLVLCKGAGNDNALMIL
jgi:hypothetical protein